MSRGEELENEEMTTKAQRVLIATILPGAGGVPAMTSFIVRCLKERGLEPVIAYYSPYSLTPELSVPSFRLLRSTIGSRRVADVDGCETHAVGAWLPELEFTHYFAARPWKSLMASCAHHMAVAGSAQALTAFYQSNLPYLGWIATGWAEDVAARGNRFSAPRRVLDGALNAPMMLALERRILRSGTILALSEHTARTLDDVAGKPVTEAVLPMPIDTGLFAPGAGTVVEGRIGFSARLGDPRKNVGLLLAAIGLLAERGTNVTLDLIGGEMDAATAAEVARLGIADRVRILPYMSKPALADQLRTLDVYVVPSHQEGLCIAAIEAMACGCPVVSTRCGGPAEFVIDGETGYLVGFGAEEMAARIAGIVSDRTARQKLSHGARRMVETRYDYATASRIFWQAFETTFGKREAA